MFFDEFSSLLEGLFLAPCALLISGDFNIHIGEPDDTHRFLQVLQLFDLTRHVNKVLHKLVPTDYPTICISDSYLANKYIEFFNRKIAVLCSSLSDRLDNVFQSLMTVDRCLISVLCLVSDQCLCLIFRSFLYSKSTVKSC